MTTAAREATTTEPRRRFFERHPIPVRFRITVAVVLLAGLALTGAGLVVYAVESNRLDRVAAEQVGQEIAEFEQLQSGKDPLTGEEFASAQRLLTLSLKRNVASPDEMIVAFWDGRAQFKSVDPPHPGFEEDPQLAAEVAALQDIGGSREIDTPHGPALLAVKPVSDAITAGAFVVVYFFDGERAALADTMETYAIVAGFALLAVTMGAWIVSGRLLRPVRELRTAAQEISDTDLTRRIEATGNDDLTDLTRTFNAMLDRLEDAFSTQRQFLDDAGHELRTPITIVRGHLELVNPDDPNEVAATRALVLNEMVRMSRLVDDLIVLAKARRPDFVRTQPTDIGALTDDIAEKIRALGRRDWRVDERADGLEVLDAQRITQAVAQLAQNAVQHTDDEDLVAVGSQVDDGLVSFWVRDAGDGIAPADRERIFQRFERGSNVSTDEGTGLGLSIVNAIAEAHGGSVRVDSTPGHGATFTVLVPRRSVG